jgi:hypothetical protein
LEFTQWDERPENSRTGLSEVKPREIQENLAMIKNGQNFLLDLNAVSYVEVSEITKRLTLA